MFVAHPHPEFLDFTVLLLAFIRNLLLVVTSEPFYPLLVLLCLLLLEEIKLTAELVNGTAVLAGEILDCFSVLTSQVLCLTTRIPFLLLQLVVEVADVLLGVVDVGLEAFISAFELFSFTLEFGYWGLLAGQCYHVPVWDLLQLTSAFGELQGVDMTLSLVQSVVDHVLQLLELILHVPDSAIHIESCKPT